ncbi:MAG: 2-amino-4-hydroxy-6-hydroxymethyldihydropteridine diphosphokinase [Reyranellaceae bacterium]
MENHEPGAIYIGVGGNLPHPVHGAPRPTLERALEALPGHGVQVLAVSPWYRTAPQPPSGQPWFLNAVARVATGLGPAGLLAALHAVEHDFGRVRGVANAARIIDLDLLDYAGRCSPGGAGEPILPHPRLQDRAFVLRPLADLAPAWRHPVSGQTVAELLAALPAGQPIERA